MLKIGINKIMTIDNTKKKNGVGFDGVSILNLFRFPKLSNRQPE